MYKMKFILVEATALEADDNKREQETGDSSEGEGAPPKTHRILGYSLLHS
jgi:hypothetical protein